MLLPKAFLLGAFVLGLGVIYLVCRRLAAAWLK